jgi:hypothetical protein
MGRINWGRVILGGLVAGLVFTVTDFFVNGVLLGQDWENVLKTLGHPGSPTALIFFVTWAFLAGIGSIWLYAAVRPRFGPGPKTAILAGFAFWIFDDALPTLGQLAFGLIPRRLLLIGVCVGLVEGIVASLAGAWLYTE